jgi:hypothetical protein
MWLQFLDVFPSQLRKAVPLLVMSACPLGTSWFCAPYAVLTFVAVVTEVSSGYCGLVAFATWLLSVPGLAVSFCSHDYLKAAEVLGDV